MKDDGTRPIKDGTLMDVEEDVEQVIIDGVGVAPEMNGRVRFKI